MSLRPVEPADLFRFRFVQSAAFSPDGRYVAYVVSHVEIDEKNEKEKEKEHAAIWLHDLETGKSTQLTSGSASDHSPRWSPDGQSIAFLSNRHEKMQIFIIPIHGGEARQVTKFVQGVGGAPSWSPDGKHLAFTACPITEPRDPTKPYRVTRFAYRFNEMEYIDDVAQSIYVISAEGGEARRITEDAFMNSNPTWSPDGKELLYLASMQPDIHDSFFARPRIVNLLDNSVRDLILHWGYAYSASWMPDGEHITFIGLPSNAVSGSKADLWVVSAQGGVPECRTRSLVYGTGGGLQPDMPVFPFLTTVPMSKDGKTAYVPVQIGGTEQIYAAALQGDEAYTPLVTGDRSALLMGASEQHLLYIVSTLNSPTEVYISDLNGQNERRLTQINDELLAQLELPEIEHLVFPGVDGVQVEGWAVIPRRGKKPFPTILYIHGGPHSAFGHIFHFDTQLLCGAGYAVLLINHRASTGYGDEFSTAIKGAWGTLDYTDLMAGVDEAIQRGIADANRLGVCGLSGGGNLSCWIVGQTNRFKAAIPENPVTNWVSFYGVSDIGVWFSVGELGGHPHEIPEVYARCSPITYAHRCKTPTLLVQGEHDWRCPPEQSEQFYTVLKANGCTVEMLRLPNAAHAATITGALVHRRAHNEAMLEWFNRYVLGAT